MATAKFCDEGAAIVRNARALSDDVVKESLKSVLSYESWHTSRQDHMYRVDLINKYLAGKVKVLPCMPFPDASQCDQITKISASMKPPCKGTKTIEFHKFNHNMCKCDDQLNRRFREFVITGMCHMCQAWYVEQMNG